MLLRTHFVFSILLLLLFLEHVEYKIIFSIMVLIATITPDLDSKFSSWGRHLIFRPLQFFVKHRGIIHSFTTAFVLSIIIAIFWPTASLGFFLGFSVHLICDSFTKDGVQPFWPLKTECNGPIKTGGKIEEILFVTMIFVDIFIFFVMFVL